MIEYITDRFKALLLAILFFTVFFAFCFALAMIGWYCHPEAEGEDTIEYKCKEYCTECYMTSGGDYITWHECELNPICYEDCLEFPELFLGD